MPKVPCPAAVSRRDPVMSMLAPLPGSRFWTVTVSGLYRGAEAMTSGEDGYIRRYGAGPVGDGAGGGPPPVGRHAAPTRPTTRAAVATTARRGRLASGPPPSRFITHRLRTTALRGKRANLAHRRARFPRSTSLFGSAQSMWETSERAPHYRAAPATAASRRLNGDVDCVPFHRARLRSVRTSRPDTR